MELHLTTSADLFFMQRYLIEYIEYFGTKFFFTDSYHQNDWLLTIMSIMCGEYVTDVFHCYIAAMKQLQVADGAGMYFHKVYV